MRCTNKELEIYLKACMDSSEEAHDDINEGDIKRILDYWKDVEWERDSWDGWVNEQY